MLRLRPYKPCDARVITQWIKDEYSLHLWGSNKYENYPITPEDMNRYYDKDKNNDKIWAMTAFEDNGTIMGHLTMRFPKADDLYHIRLGFVIVDDRQRGKGYGTEMVSLAVSYAFNILKVKKVSLGVFENNPAAIQCYESCGFKKVPQDSPKTRCCMGEEWNCIEMECILCQKN